MTDQLITIQTAKLAKEKGVNLLSEYFYDDYPENHPFPDFDDDEENWNQYEDKYTCVTQSLLQKWLREVHDIDIIPPLRFDEGYVCAIVRLDDTEFFKTYEEALEIALQEALKLIPNETL